MALITLPGILRRLKDHINTQAAHGSALAERVIGTTAPLRGGGDLSADRTLSVDAATEKNPGAVRLATAKEAADGESDALAVHPLGLKTALEAHGSVSFKIFEGSGVFTAPDRGTAIVTLAGGGQAGALSGGPLGGKFPGGAAGQIIHATIEMKAGEKASVVVADGGAGNWTRGGASYFGDIMALGGNLTAADINVDSPPFNGGRTTYGVNGAAVTTGSGLDKATCYGGQGGYHYPLLTLDKNMKGGDSTGKGGLGYGGGGGAGNPSGRGCQGVVAVMFITHKK